MILGCACHFFVPKWSALLQGICGLGCASEKRLLFGGRFGLVNRCGRGAEFLLAAPLNHVGKMTTTARKVPPAHLLAYPEYGLWRSSSDQWSDVNRGNDRLQVSLHLPLSQRFAATQGPGTRDQGTFSYSCTEGRTGLLCTAEIRLYPSLLKEHGYFVYAWRCRYYLDTFDCTRTGRPSTCCCRIPIL